MWTLGIHKNDELVFTVLTEITCQPSGTVWVPLSWELSLLLFSCVWLFVTPRSVAHQGPLSLGFSRQECWSVLSLPSPGGTFPTQGLNSHLLYRQVDSLPLGYLGSPQTPLSQGYWPALCLFCGSWDGNHSQLPAPPQLEVGSPLPHSIMPHRASSGQRFSTGTTEQPISICSVWIKYKEHCAQ